MKKFILPFIIFGLLVFIVIREIKIHNTSSEKKQLTDSLQKMKMLLEWNNSANFNDLQFNWIVCTPIYDKIVKSDDTLSVKVMLSARNTVKENSGMSEAYVTLGKRIDVNHNLTDIYDTINAIDWLCEIKIKTQGLGVDSLLGSFNIPWKDNTTITYPFQVKYTKVDNNAFKSIMKFQK